MPQSLVVPVRAQTALPGAVLALLVVAGCTRGPMTAAVSDAAPAPSAQARADELLSADRAWSARAAGRPFPDALGPMLAADVRSPVRDRVLVGREPVLATLRATADSGATVHWHPVRAGLSNDGQHGFTAGVQWLVRPNGERVAARYLAYWVRTAPSGAPAEWTVVAWRRRTLTVAPDTTMLPPFLPVRLVGVRDDRDSRDRQYADLVAAEQGFSDLANRIGVGAAFAQMGDPDAINLGAPNDPRFVRGNNAIASLVAGGQPLNAPSAIVWRADTAIVASSGDLGITFGVIRPKPRADTPAPPGGAAFFTIWRKASPQGAWRYVAE